VVNGLLVFGDITLHDMYNVP